MHNYMANPVGSTSPNGSFSSAVDCGNSFVSSGHDSSINRSRSYSPTRTNDDAGLLPRRNMRNQGVEADSISPPTLSRAKTDGEPNIGADRPTNLRRHKSGGPGASRLSLLPDYTFRQADVQTLPPISRKVTAPQDSATSNFELPARKYPKAKPVSGVALDMSLLDDSSKSDSTNMDVSGQSVEEMIQFRVRNPNSVPSVPPPPQKPILSPNQLMMGKNHKVLHCISEDDEDKRESSTSNNFSEHSQLASPKASTHGSSHSYNRSSNHANKRVVGTSMDDSANSFACDDANPNSNIAPTRSSEISPQASDTLRPSESSTSEESNATTSTSAFTSNSQRFSCRKSTVLPALEEMPQKDDPVSADPTPPQSPKASTPDSSMDPSKSKQHLTSSMEQSKLNPTSRLLTAAAKAVEKPPKRRPRRNTSDDKTSKDIARAAPSLRRAQTEEGSTSRDQFGIEGSGRMRDESAMDASSTTRGRRAPPRRTKSSDGIGLGRVRRAGRRDGSGVAGGVDEITESPRRLPSRTRSNDGMNIVPSSRGRVMRRTSATDQPLGGDSKNSNIQARKDAFRRSKSSVTPGDESQKDSPARSLSPGRKSRESGGFGSSHPASFNSSRIRRFNKDDVIENGMSSSNFGGHEFRKLMQSHNDGLFMSAHK